MSYSFVYRVYIFENETVEKVQFPDDIIFLGIERYKHFEIEIYQCKEMKSLVDMMHLYKELISVRGDVALPEFFFNGQLLPDSEKLFTTFMD